MMLAMFTPSQKVFAKQLAEHVLSENTTESDTYEEVNFEHLKIVLEQHHKNDKGLLKCYEQRYQSHYKRWSKLPNRLATGLKLNKIKIGQKTDFGAIKPIEVKDNSITCENLTIQQSVDLDLKMPENGPDNPEPRKNLLAFNFYS